MRGSDQPSKVEHGGGVRPGQSAIHILADKDVALDHRNTVGPTRSGGTRASNEAEHPIATIDQPPNEMPADKAAGPGDQDGLSKRDCDRRDPGCEEFCGCSGNVQA
jgi:hypothetical protein